MPFTFNGIGTKLYGARDFGPDGSYVTTEWFTIFYVPIFPIKSIRKLPTGNGVNLLVFASSGYRYANVPLNGMQVLLVYSWFVVVVGSFWAAGGLDLWWLAIPGIVTLFVPWILRKCAIQRTREEYARAHARIEA